MSISIRSLARLLSGRMLPRIAYPVVRGPLRGSRLVLGSMAGEGGGASAYFNLVEPEKTAALAQALRPGGVFFDVGANVGYYTLLASRRLGPKGRVIAFEPSVTNLSYLHRHVLLNNLTNVLIVPAACSDVHSLEAFDAGPNRAMGYLVTERADEGTRQLSLVPTVTVDAAAQKLGVSPDVLKIDVEGAEVSVLCGAKATIERKKPVIFLEVHSENLKASCLEYLRGFGYVFRILSRDEAASTEDIVASVGALTGGEEPE